MATFSKRYALGYIAGSIAMSLILNLEVTTALESIGKLMLVLGVYLGIKYIAMMAKE